MQLFFFTPGTVILATDPTLSLYSDSVRTRTEARAFKLARNKA